MNTAKVKIKSINTEKLIGKTLPTNEHGHAGRAFEVLVEQIYKTKTNKGQGPDNEFFGIEYKTRDLDAVSPQTVGTMNVREIIDTPFAQSPIAAKFQQQLRAYTRDGVIISADLFDFRSKFIQDLMESAYESARQQLTADPLLVRTASEDHLGKWGYFENTNRDSPDSRSFRINPAGMEAYEALSKSNIENLFDYE
jgi:hypothetical protein